MYLKIMPDKISLADFMEQVKGCGAVFVFLPSDDEGGDCVCVQAGDENSGGIMFSVKDNKFFTLSGENYFYTKVAEALNLMWWGFTHQPKNVWQKLTSLDFG